MPCPTIKGGPSWHFGRRSSWQVSVFIQVWRTLGVLVYRGSQFLTICSWVVVHICSVFGCSALGILRFHIMTNWANRNATLSQFKSIQVGRVIFALTWSFGSLAKHTIYKYMNIKNYWVNIWGWLEIVKRWQSAQTLGCGIKHIRK